MTHRDEGIEIILGTQLMPHYTFQTHRRGCLLVPVPDFPTFVAAPQYHAGQALLQMLVMEEFTNQSIELVTEGSIHITKEQWASFHEESALPISIFNKVLNQWQGEFLVQIQADRYSLGEKYQKELKFLEAQGMIRRDRKYNRQITTKKRSLIQYVPTSRVEYPYLSRRTSLPKKSAYA